MAGLQFSDVTNRQGLMQDCEDNLSLGATAITGSSNLKLQFTRYINQWYHKVVTMILLSQDDWDYDDANNTDYPVATTPLVASQRDYTFPISLKVLKIKRVDITYDGTNYYKAEPFDSGETGLGLGNDTITDGRYSKTQPFYDLKANSIWIYPEAATGDVSAGGKIRIEFYRDISEFAADGSDTTKVPGFDTPFHRMLSLGASYEYAAIHSMAVAGSLQQQLVDYENRLKLYYGKKDDDAVYVLKSSSINYN